MVFSILYWHINVPMVFKELEKVGQIEYFVKILELPGFHESGHVFKMSLLFGRKYRFSVYCIG